MKLPQDTKTDAQALADRLHQHAIDTNPLYAESVRLGHTLRWCVPQQTVDKDGKVIDAAWVVPIDERVAGGLTKDERAAVPALKQQDDKAAELKLAVAVTQDEKLSDAKAEEVESLKEVPNE